jgi:hypothetical protein
MACYGRPTLMPVLPRNWVNGSTPSDADPTDGLSLNRCRGLFGPYHRGDGQRRVLVTKKKSRVRYSPHLAAHQMVAPSPKPPRGKAAAPAGYSSAYTYRGRIIGRMVSNLRWVVIAEPSLGTFPTLQAVRIALSKLPPVQRKSVRFVDRERSSSVRAASAGLPGLGKRR